MNTQVLKVLNKAREDRQKAQEEVRHQEYLNTYRPAILLQASSEPKSIYGLMEGLGCWDSVEACNAVKKLVAEGILTETHSTGEFFQHKYFTLTKPSRP